MEKINKNNMYIFLLFARILLYMYQLAALPLTLSALSCSMSVRFYFAVACGFNGAL